MSLTFSDADLEARVDPDRFLRALQNLIGNALEALGPKGGGHVAVDARLTGAGIELSVSDDGPGIPEAIRGQLFQPFVTLGKRHGTGLGLAISKTLVEAHGGEISVT